MNIRSTIFNRRTIEGIGGVAVTALIAIQFIRPTIAERPVTGDIPVPAEVKAILKRSCYDCHSNETRLSWADQIAPVYWRVARHVNAGRAHLNFSEWDQLSLAEQKLKIWEAVNHASLGAMPRADYALVHPAARLSAADIATLKNYLSGLVNSKPSDSATIHAAASQYKEWVGGEQLRSLPVSPNGIAYDSSYKNWLPISTSDRFESGTMRVVFGNAIAIQAVKNNQTRPWPDGTRFAKALWTQVVDSAGNAHTGTFVQVDLMIKNKQQYASTGGWGFARFKSLKLVPYGGSAVFAQECINCHRPMKAQDYVFTIPVKQ